MFKYETEQSVHGSESLEKVRTSVLSPSEALLHPEDINSPWPESITKNELILEQAKNRRDILNEFDEIFKKTPDATIDVATMLAEKIVTQEEIDTLYANLNTFFSSDILNSRMLLYFPFEMIPTEGTSETANLFRAQIKKTWNYLLREKDFRTNFFDGDIPEEEARTGTMPEVVKAAHMIPFLLQKNLLTVSEVQELFEQSTDDTLRSSIADALPVAMDLRLISEDEESKLEESNDGLLRNVLILAKLESETEDTESTVETKDIETLNKKLQEELAEADGVYTSNIDVLPKARNDWDRLFSKKKIVSKYAEQIAQAIIEEYPNGSLAPGELLKLEQDTYTQQVGVEAIRKAVEIFALKEKDLEKAQKLIEETKNIFEQIHAGTELASQDAVEVSWLRWSKISGIKDVPVIDDKTQKYVNDMCRGALAIQADEDLANKVYPVANAWGSKAKGYGTEMSDTDVAVFVKPGTDRSTNQEIKSELATIFTEPGKEITKPQRFWLREEGDYLKIESVLDITGRTADENWVQTLFNGIWTGDAETIKELHAKVLVPYFYAEGKKVGPFDAREFWLNEMERGTLLFRLMQKGYQRTNLEQGGIKTAHSKDIDGDCMYWDSGYRRLATQLFLKKMFLPNLGVK